MNPKLRIKRAELKTPEPDKRVRVRWRMIGDDTPLPEPEPGEIVVTWADVEGTEDDSN